MKNQSQIHSTLFTEEGESKEGELVENQIKVGDHRKHSLLVKAFTEKPWAILPEKLAILEEIVMRHVQGEKLDTEEIQAAIHGAKRPANRKDGEIAILPLFGVIFPRANLMTQTSGATSAELFSDQFDELVNDPKVSAIILDVDSPGGNIEGILETSQKIYEARGKKPIVAVANHMMASAAYWISTAADEVVVTPSGAVGSIGVWSYHDDESGAMAQAGVKRTLISAGKYKVEGNPWEPLSEEAKAAIQSDVDEGYAEFVRDVARNRGVEVAIVRNGYGEGRMVKANKAVRLRMADRIGTLAETVKRLQSPGQVAPGRPSSAKSLLSEDQRREADELHQQVHSILHDPSYLKSKKIKDPGGGKEKEVSNDEDKVSLPLTPDQRDEADALHKRVKAILNRPPAIRKPY